MPQEGVEVPFHPPAEAAPNATVFSPEGSIEVSDRQRAKNAVAEGFGFIKNKHDSGFFDAGDKVDAKKDAEKVLDQAKNNSLDSDGLKAFFNSMSTIGEETVEVSKRAAEHMRVKVGDEAIARFLTLDEWRAELETAQKPVDGSSPDPARIKELEEGIFAYSFPKTSQENPESANILKEKSPEDILIAKYKNLFERQIEAARKRGVDASKEDMQTLAMLRIAEAANGEVGVIAKHGALKNLAVEQNVAGLDSTINTLEEQMPSAIQKACELMESQGMGEMALKFRKAVETGNLQELIASGKLSKVEGFRELLFGKDFKEEDMKRLISQDKKNKWKNPLLIALIIMLVGSVEIVQIAQKASQEQR